MRSLHLGEADVHPLRQPPRTRSARSIVDAASWVSTDDDARATVAAAIQQRIVAADQVVSTAERIGRFPRRRLVLETAMQAGAGAHPVLEVALGRLLRQARLPKPTHQGCRTDGAGRRRWVDVAWETYGVVVEVDGMWHMEPAAWWADMERQNDLVTAGDLLLRFPGFAITRRPHLVARQVSAALHSRGWTGALS